MIRSMTALLVLATAFSAHAGKKRENFTLDLLGKVEALNAVEKLRVYVNKKVIVKHISEKKVEVDVGTGIDIVKRGKELKQVLDDDTRGKIIAVEKPSRDVTKVYVTFDPNCNQKDCAFSFTPVPQYDYYAYDSTYTPATQEFYLATVPRNSDYAVTEAKRKVFLGKRSLFGSEHNIMRTEAGKVVELEVKLDELEEIIKQRKDFPGVD